MKKITLALCVLLMSFLSLQVNSVEARGFRAGKRFSVQQPNKMHTKSTSIPKLTTNPFFRGLMVGGIAGLLFSSFLKVLGPFGSIIGLLINGIAIYFIIRFILQIKRRYF